MAEGPSHTLARLGNELVDQARQYAQLMRLDKPVGIWLLLWPTLWGLWIAGAGRPEQVNFLVFVAGVVVMRSAGCVINDFADRHIDGAVARTRSRPLAAGLVTSAEALALFAVLGLVALAGVFAPHSALRAQVTPAGCRGEAGRPAGARIFGRSGALSALYSGVLTTAIHHHKSRISVVRTT